MPKLLTHHSQDAIKLLLLGDSGTGKTSALLSLLEAGYELAILDFDAGLDPLVQLIRTRPNAEDLLGRVYYETCVDKMRAVGGTMVPVPPVRAFARAMELLTHWKTDSEDLGPVSDWTPHRVLVLDSFTFMSKAAFRWVEALNISKDGRAIYGEAQKRIEGCLALLYSPQIQCNVIAISHIVYLETEGSITTRGFPSTIGRALSPTVPRYFNTVLQCASKPGGTRVIKTRPDGIVDLKSSVPPERLPAEFPLATGLRQYFELAGVHP